MLLRGHPTASLLRATAAQTRRGVPRSETRRLRSAAADLGATPWQTLYKIIIPLCAPGLRAAGVLVFIPCLGAYLTPDLLGGGKSIMIGNLIQNQFTTARDWPFGSAISLALMALVMILLITLLRQDGEEAL